MNILLRNRFFRHECFVETWMPRRVCAQKCAWYLDYRKLPKNKDVLLWSCESGWLDVVKQIPYDIIYEYKYHVVKISSTYGHLHCVRYLMENIGSYEKINLYNALGRAVAGGFIHITKYFIEDIGLDAKKIDSLYIEECIFGDHWNVCKYIIDKGAPMFDVVISLLNHHKIYYDEYGCSKNIGDFDGEPYWDQIELCIFYNIIDIKTFIMCHLREFFSYSKENNNLEEVLSVLNHHDICYDEYGCPKNIGHFYGEPDWKEFKSCILYDEINIRDFIKYNLREFLFYI